MYQQLLSTALVAVIGTAPQNTKDRGVAELESLGVRFVEGTGSDVTARCDVFQAGPFGAIEWTDSTDSGSESLEFLPLKGTERMMASWSTADQPEYAKWSDQLDVVTWSEGQGTLTLTRKPGDSAAEGRVWLTLPTALKRHNNSVVVTGYQAACGASVGPEFPWTLTSTDTIPIGFVWDLHSMVDIDGVHMSLVSDAVLPSIPIRLDGREDVVRGMPRELDSVQGLPVRLTLASNGGGVVSLREIKHRPCVRVCDVERYESSQVVVLQETDDALLPHECSSVKVKFLVGGDPIPFYRSALLRHSCMSEDEEGRAFVEGVFCPGERVIVMRGTGGVISLDYVDRLCGGSNRGRADCHRVGMFDVPAEEGLMDVVVGSPSDGVRVRGRIRSAVEKSMQRWVALCGR